MEATVLVYSRFGRWFAELRFDDGTRLLSDDAFATEPEARAAIGAWCDLYRIARLAPN